MSSLAATAPVRARAASRRAAAASESQKIELALRLAAFAALCLFATLHWARLVVPAAGGRAFAVALVATAGAAVMGTLSSGLVRTPRRVTPALQALLVLATLALTLIAIGLPARFLAPAHWADFRNGLDRGLTGTSTISWPYAAGDEWIRLSILMAIPAAATLAAAFAFVPRGVRTRAAGRLAALVVLVGLYAFAVTEISLGSAVLRGLALLVLIAAWLWLPNVRRTDALAAAAVVLAAGIVAIPLSRSLDATRPWIDWTQWSWFSAAGGERFAWDHQYGPLTWPRTGKTLLEVKASGSHYWKAETLDRFDGVRWEHSGYYSGIDVDSSLPPRLDPSWIDKIHVSLTNLQTNVLIGAGTLLDYNGDRAIATSGDGTANIVDRPIGKGDSYDIKAYVPNPTADEMREAPFDTSSDVQSWTNFELASPTLRTTPRVTRAPRWNVVPAANDLDVASVMASPYRRVYELARNLGAGAGTQYDVVKRVEGYLASHRFSYNEQPPVRRFPLAAFLLRDHVGYCQQFSGAMALMLRMDGIPARVAAGFAPGVFDSTTKEFRVRDLDAHSWVEVWFKGIGWVPFDPTPSAAPASSQSGGSSATSAANGSASDKGASGASDPRDRQTALKAANGNADTSNRSLWIALGVLAAVVGLAVGVLWLALTVRARRLGGRHDTPAVAELAAALALLGYRIPPGTTLAQLEQRLRVVTDPRAAEYVRLLRDARYAPRAAAGPTPADRRSLRSALTAGRGIRARIRGFVALPPHLRRADATTV